MNTVATNYVALLTLPSRATCWMATITIATALATALMISFNGLVPPVEDISTLFALCTVLALIAFYYRRQGAANFVLTLKSLIVMVSFSAVFSMMSYCIALNGRPIADEQLAKWDKALGLSAGALIEWVDARPTLRSVLALSYFSMLPQTMLVIMILGLLGDGKRLDSFLLRFMVGAWFAALGFYFWPALGTFTEFDYTPPKFHNAFVQHLEELRSGGRLTVSWKGAQGLITFPSFHTIWAILLTAAFHQRWLLFALFLILNTLVIVSTVSTGMHYFVDVLAGGIIAVILCLSIQPRRLAS